MNPLIYNLSIYIYIYFFLLTYFGVFLAIRKLTALIPFGAHNTLMELFYPCCLLNVKQEQMILANVIRAKWKHIIFQCSMLHTFSVLKCN